ncbi:MAG: hypothetical protein ACKVRP_10485 [Bacteroidota bacterium]
MKSYIFVTSEGYTYQPNSESEVPDIENLQVIGFAAGVNEQEALRNLLSENSWIQDSSFSEVMCYQLQHVAYDKKAIMFNLMHVAR